MDEINEHRNMNRLYEYYQKSLPAMQEQLVMGILEGKGDRRAGAEYAGKLRNGFQGTLLRGIPALCRCRLRRDGRAEPAAAEAFP